MYTVLTFKSEKDLETYLNGSLGSDTIVSIVVRGVAFVLVTKSA